MKQLNRAELKSKVNDCKLNDRDNLLMKSVIDDDQLPRSMVQYMLLNGADVLSGGCMAVRLCGSTNNADLFRYLLKRIGYQVFCPVLEISAKNGSLEVFKVAYAALPEYLELEGYDRQLIELACTQGHLSIVKHIVDEGFLVPNEQTDAGPFFFAKKEGHTDIYNYLKEHEPKS